MSTRCQVRVIQEGLWDESVTLYHHYDGYPENILPLFQKAFSFGENWERGRARKVASFLCAVDPGNFEPEDSHELHGDIEYYYILYCINTDSGSMDENPKWEVEIYIPDNKFHNEAIFKNLKFFKKRASIMEKGIGERLEKDLEIIVLFNKLNGEERKLYGYFCGYNLEKDLIFVWDNEKKAIRSIKPDSIRHLRVGEKEYINE